MTEIKKYNIKRMSGKTYRDKKSSVILYHVSPNRLSRISGLSRFNGISGAYLSPSYSSIIRDWMFYVKGKKHKKHPLDAQWRKTWDKIDEIKEIENKTQEEEYQLKLLNEKIEKLRKSIDNDKYQDSISGYKNIYIHKVECPKHVEKQSKEFFNKAYDEGYRKDCIGFWCWGEQIFIPEVFLPELKILNIEELNISEMHDKYKDFNIGMRGV